MTSSHSHLKEKAFLKDQQDIWNIVRGLKKKKCCGFFSWLYFPYYLHIAWPWHNADKEADVATYRSTHFRKLTINSSDIQ